LILFDYGLVSSAAGGYIFICERFRDENGDVITSGSGEGWAASLGGGSTGSTMRKSGATTQPAWQCLGVGSAALPNGRKRLGSIVAGDNEPFIGVVTVKSGEVSAGDSGAASVFADSHTYKVSSLSATFTLSMPSFGYNGGTVACVIALLNE
jgi:hypothetical protein